MRFSLDKRLILLILRRFERVNPSYKKCTVRLCVHKGGELTWEAFEEGTNTEIVTHIEGQFDTGDAIVPLHRLTQIVTSMPDVPLSLFTDSAYLHLQCKGVHCKIALSSNTSFPVHTRESTDDIEVFMLPYSVFHDIIYHVAFSATNKQAPRRFFQCICISPVNGSLDFVATDIARMAHVTIACAYNLSGQLIIPAAELEQFSSALSEEDGYVRGYLRHNARGIILSTAKMRHFIVLPNEGMYPKYVDIYPLNYTSTADVRCEDLLSAILRAQVYNEHPLEGVEFELKDQHLTVFCAKESGAAQTVIECKFTSGEGFRIKVPALYLEQALERCGEIVTLRYCCDEHGRRWPLICSSSSIIAKYSIMPLFS